MRFVIALLLLAGIVLASNNGLQSQDKKDPPKVKGMLPANWGKLDLTQDQKSAIYKIQAKYKDDIAKMEAAIKEKQAEQLREMVKVLTDDQKKRLQELATGGTKDEKK
jgi:Spy/CpxP family protein refolding chaperone